MAVGSGFIQSKQSFVNGVPPRPGGVGGRKSTNNFCFPAENACLIPLFSLKGDCFSAFLFAVQKYCLTFVRWGIPSLSLPGGMPGRRSFMVLNFISRCAKLIDTVLSSKRELQVVRRSYRPIVAPTIYIKVLASDSLSGAITPFNSF